MSCSVSSMIDTGRSYPLATTSPSDSNLCDRPQFSNVLNLNFTSDGTATNDDMSCAFCIVIYITCLPCRGKNCSIFSSQAVMLSRSAALL